MIRIVDDEATPACSASMATVAELVEQSKSLEGQLTVRVKDGVVQLVGSADGFRMFAEILRAQADGEVGNGPTPCSSLLKRDDESGVLLGPESADAVWLHCH